MNITIIYPREDYDAANVAIKVQALAQSKNQRVYVVPKHHGRNKSEIERKLGETNVALFISQSDSEIDQPTIDELKYLKSKDKRIIGFLPDNIQLPRQLEQYISLKRYHKGDTVSLRTTIIDYLSEIQKNTENQNATLIVVGLILFLFLLAFNSDD